MKTKKALITGITGQDGSYMAEYLLSLGYEVHGIVRRCSIDNLLRVNHILDRLVLHQGDLIEHRFVENLIRLNQYDIVYNFAAQSHVHTSFNIPSYTWLVNYDSADNIMSAINKFSRHTKFYQASTSEMFGNSPAPQGLNSSFDPQSPYAESKLKTHEMICNRRDVNGIFAVSGILFNHESPRRGTDFVTRKITKAVGEFFLNSRSIKKPLKLGNIDACRDWGFAAEYVKEIHAHMDKSYPEDFVLGTGETHSVREFLAEAFRVVGIDKWERYVEYNDDAFTRPREVNILQANISRKPVVDFSTLVMLMVTHDCNLIAPLWWENSDFYGVFAWRVSE